MRVEGLPITERLKIGAMQRLSRRLVRNQARVERQEIEGERIADLLEEQQLAFEDQAYHGTENPTI